MRALSLIVGIFSTVLCVAAAAFAEESANREAMSERIAIQEARLPQIEEAAARERDETERSYERSHADLVREIGREGAARLNSAQRSLWTEFARMEAGKPYPEGYFDASHLGFPFSYRTTLLRQAMVEEYFVEEMGSLLLSEDFERRLAQMADERLEVPLTPLLRREARGLLALVMRLRAELAMELRPLENARTARLEATMEWERDLKEQVRGILEYLRQQEGREPDFGVVESIGHCPRGGYYCTIEGVDRVLGIGDTVDRVRVVRIDSRNVEFARDGVTWVQQLGAPAQPYWKGGNPGGVRNADEAARVSRMD